MRFSPLLQAVALAFSTVSCGADEKESATPSFEPKLSVIEREIFAKSCTFSSCHGELTPREGLSLAGSTYDRLINVLSKQSGQLLVKPGDPDASYLVEKLSQLSPTAGVRMPQGQPALDPGAVATIVAWVRAGALPN